MDTSSSSSLPSGKSASLLGLVLIFILGLVVGFGLYHFSGPLLSLRTARSQLPVSSDALSNPAFYNWQAIVRGEVVEVSAASITLKVNGESISLPTAGEAKVLRFMPGKDPEQFSFAELKAGETIAARVLFTNGKPEVSGAQVISSEE